MTIRPHFSVTSIIASCLLAACFPVGQKSKVKTHSEGKVSIECEVTGFNVGQAHEIILPRVRQVADEACGGSYILEELRTKNTERTKRVDDIEVLINFSCTGDLEPDVPMNTVELCTSILRKPSDPK